VTQSSDCVGRILAEVWEAKNLIRERVVLPSPTLGAPRSSYNHLLRNQVCKEIGSRYFASGGG